VIALGTWYGRLRPALSAKGSEKSWENELAHQNGTDAAREPRKNTVAEAEARNFRHAKAGGLSRRVSPTFVRQGKKPNRRRGGLLLCAGANGFELELGQVGASKNCHRC